MYSFFFFFKEIKPNLFMYPLKTIIVKCLCGHCSLMINTTSFSCAMSEAVVNFCLPFQSPVQGGPFVLPSGQLDQEAGQEHSGQEQHSPLTPTHPPQHLGSPLTQQQNSLSDQSSQQHHHRHVQQLLQQHIQMQSLMQQQQQIEQQQQQLQQLQEQLQQHFQHQQRPESPSSPHIAVPVPSPPVSLSQGESLPSRAWHTPDVTIHVPSSPNLPVTQADPAQSRGVWQEFTPHQEAVFQQQLQTIQEMQDMQKQLQQQQQVEQHLQQQQHHQQHHQETGGAPQVVTMAGDSPQQPYPILQQHLMLGPCLQQGSSGGEQLQSPVEQMTLPTFSDVLPQQVQVHQEPLPSTLSNSIDASDGLSQPVFVSATPITVGHSFIGGDRQQDLTDAQLLTSVVASIISGQHPLPSMDQSQGQFHQNGDSTSHSHAAVSDHPEVSLADVNLHNVHLPPSTSVSYESRLTENSTDPIMVNNSLHPATSLSDPLLVSSQPSFVTHHHQPDSSIKSEEDKLFTSQLQSKPPSEISPFTFRPVNTGGTEHGTGNNKANVGHGSVAINRDKYLPLPIGSTYSPSEKELKPPSRKRHKSEGVIGTAAKRPSASNLAMLLQKGAGASSVSKSVNAQSPRPEGEAKLTKTADERNKLLQRSKSEDHTFMRPRSRVDDPYYRPRSRTEDSLHRSKTYHHEDFLSRSDGAGIFRNPGLSLSPIRAKKKHRPAPLIIPPHVNSCGFQSRLRSPRLWDGGGDGRLKRGSTPPPYTPPPMLSPVRSGSGLFWMIHPGFRPMTPKSAPIAPRLSLTRRGQYTYQ